MLKEEKSTGYILIVGIPNQNPDLLYRTRFAASDPVVYLERGKRRWLVVSRMELGRAQKTARGAQVLTPEDLRLEGEERRKMSAWALALLRRLKVRAVRVAGNFPYGVARRLLQKRIRLTVEERALYPMRGVKTRRELRAIRRAQRAAAAALKAAVAQLAAARVNARGVLETDGRALTAAALRRIIHAELLAHDCAASDTIVACGRQAADPHAKGHGPLRARQAIVIDIFPRQADTGYWGDLTRTVVKGRPAPALRRMYRAVQLAQSAALRAIRAGAPLSAPHRAAVRTFERLGFAAPPRARKPQGFIHGTGHGVGLEIHEAPALGAQRGRLRAGMVVTVEPGLYYPRLGGVRLEDTIVVTARGWRYLARCPKRFVIP
jgi:Xaa-Pro aminopeptidase